MSPTTVHRWSLRDEPQDRSSQSKRVRRALSEEIEAAALALRRKGLTLDACLDALTAGFGKIAPSTLHAPFSGRLPKALPEKRACRDYEPGFLHIDLTYLPALDGTQRYLFVAVDRATRLAFVQVRSRKTMGEATAFLKAALTFFPFEAHRLRTHNGSEFTNRFWRRRAGGAKKVHPFEAPCQGRGISHRLAAPCTPRTNGMVERSNRTLKEGAVRNRRHQDHAWMERTTLAWCAFHNAARPWGGSEGGRPSRKPFGGTTTDRRS